MSTEPRPTAIATTSAGGASRRPSPAESMVRGDRSPTTPANSAISASETVRRRVVHSPLDLQRRLPSAVHGTHQHGAFVPYQHGSMRPVPELGQYRAPVGNVYLCGAGSHPGSGVSMGQGRNAAQTVCQDLGLPFPGS